MGISAYEIFFKRSKASNLLTGIDLRLAVYQVARPAYSNSLSYLQILSE